MDTVSIVAHVTCVWLVRMQLWVHFYFILTENKGMGSGHFYKKRTDFAWVDRQPAFITGGAPGLHMYSIYVILPGRFSRQRRHDIHLQYCVYTVYILYIHGALARQMKMF